MRPGGSQPLEILASMMGRACQRRRRHCEEAFRIGDGLICFELVWRHKTRDRMVLPAWLQILSDCKEIDVRSAQIVHYLQHFVARLTEPYHDAGFGAELLMYFLQVLQKPDRSEIARTAPQRQVQRRHSFKRLIEHI